MKLCNGVAKKRLLRYNAGMIDSSVMGAYAHCMLCPNQCGTDRLHGQKGLCGQSSTLRVAWSGLHRGEEPPVKGKKGSGMIFFCGCPLHCAYCQNYQISSATEKCGIDLSIEELARMMVELQKMGAATINLVTPTQFYPSIALAIQLARSMGMRLAVVNNSSGYESVAGLQILDPLTDLYLIDVKTLDASCAGIFCGKEKYAEVIAPVMDWIVKRHPITRLDRKGLHGILVRHLWFPGQMQSTLQFLEYFKKNLAPHAWLSLMVQFVPPRENPGFKEITQEEYDLLIDKLEELEIDDGFVQNLADNIPWIPDFTQDVPFPASFADPLPYFLQLKREKLGQPIVVPTNS